MGKEIRLAETCTFSVTRPFEHGTVAGNPASSGFEVNVQLTALVTWAERCNLPPAELIGEGDAAKAVTEVGVPVMAPIGCATITPTVDSSTTPAASAPTNGPMRRFTFHPPLRRAQEGDCAEPVLALDGW